MIELFERQRQSSAYFPLRAAGVWDATKCRWWTHLEWSHHGVRSLRQHENCVAAFQRRIAQFIEENLRNNFAHLDNVTVSGRDKEEHDYNQQAFLEAISRKQFTFNENKTIATKSSIHMHGYIVGNGMVKPDPERLRALKVFPPPTCSKSLRRVIGMLAYRAK